MDSLTTPQQIQNLLQSAFAEHQAGKLQPALDKYLQIINNNQNHPDALHLAGLIYYQTGQQDKAIDLIAKSTKIAPNNADSWNNLGISYFAAKEFKHAIQSFKQCISLNKNHFQAFNNLGNAYMGLKDFQSAIKNYKSALKISPGYPEAHNNLANAYKDINKLQAAIKHYQKALELNPNYIDALKNIGIAHNEIGQHKEAIEYLEKCLQLAPQNIDSLYICCRSNFELDNFDRALDLINKAIAINNLKSDYFVTLGTILTRIERWEEAVTSFKKAIEIGPESEAIYSNLGAAYKGAHEYNSARKSYLEALKITQNNPATLNDLGVILRNLGEHKEAIEQLHRSLELNKSSKKISPAKIHNNLGLIYLDLMELDKAQTEFDKALEIDNTYPEALLGRSMIDLWKGDYESWWNGYESRLDLTKRKQEYGILAKLDTLDLGASEDNHQVIILPEQGIGDEIMFASVLSEFIESYSGNITLACDNRLVDIFQRSFPKIKVSRLNGLIATTDFKKIYLGSLAQYFRKSESDFPAYPQYLSPLKEKKLHFHNKYQNINGLKIGISWKSGNLTEGGKRSIPLEDWEALLNTKDCTFFSLQYGDTEKDITNINSKLPSTIIDDNEIDPLTDIENFIALISTLDLVITIDNSTAHFGGALGIPTWVMLPYSPDWRWLIDRHNSTWYSSLKLFRLDESKDWKITLDKIQTNLMSTMI